MSVEDSVIDLSIVIPVYNGEPYLTEAVESALQQQRSTVEVLVVDDGSTDQSAQIAKSLGARVVTIQHGGLSLARNAAIREAKGRFILWLDADDALPEKAIQHFLNALAEFPEADVFYGTTVMTNLDLRVILHRYVAPDYGALPDQFLPDLLFGAKLYMGGAMMRRTIWDRFGVFVPERHRSEDHEFWIRIAGKVSFRRVDADTYIYRQRHRSKTAMENDLAASASAMHHLLSTHPQELFFPNLKQLSSPRREGQFYYLVGQIFSKVGCWALASDYFRKSLEYVDHPGAWQALGEATLALECPGDAVLYFEKAHSSLWKALAADARWRHWQRYKKGLNYPQNLIGKLRLEGLENKAKSTVILTEMPGLVAASSQIGIFPLADFWDLPGGQIIAGDWQDLPLLSGRVTQLLSLWTLEPTAGLGAQLEEMHRVLDLSGRVEFVVDFTAYPEFYWQLLCRHAGEDRITTTPPFSPTQWLAEIKKYFDVESYALFEHDGKGYNDRNSMGRMGILKVLGRKK